MGKICLQAAILSISFYRMNQNVYTGDVCILKGNAIFKIQFLWNDFTSDLHDCCNAAMLHNGGIKKFVRVIVSFVIEICLIFIILITSHRSDVVCYSI
jgi:hypothetical protein